MPAPTGATGGKQPACCTWRACRFRCVGCRLPTHQGPARRVSLACRPGCRRSRSQGHWVGRCAAQTWLERLPPPAQPAGEQNAQRHRACNMLGYEVHCMQHLRSHQDRQDIAKASDG